MPSAKPSKTRILKNVGVVSAGFSILFTSYDGLASLQSTVNAEGNVGVVSQASLYVCFALSALILPKLVITRLGVKVTLVLSMLSYVPYVASNFYPKWSVMMPTSVLIGLGASLLWGSLANYLNDASRMYAELLLVSPNETESGKLKDRDDTMKSSFQTVNDGKTASPNGRNLTYQSEIQNESNRTRISSVISSNENETGSDKLKDSHSKMKSSFQTVNDEKTASPNDGNSSYQSEIQNEYTRSRTSSKENVENRNSHSPQDIGDKDLRNCGTTIDLNAKDSNPDSRYSVLDKCTGPEVEQNTNSSTAVSFVNSAFDAGNETDLISKRSSPAMHTGKMPIPKGFDSTLFLHNKRDSVSKQIATKLEVNRKKTISSTTARFFGFHGMVFSTSVVWSNLLTYYLMKAGSPHAGNSSASCACGASYCDNNCNDRHSFTHLADETRYLLTGTCVGLGLASVLLVALFLDPLDEATTAKGDSSKVASSATRLLLATWHMAKTPDILMLTPMSLYIGMAQAFFQADFTKAFVGCAWGTQNVGLAATSYGGACAFSSFVAGWAVRALGRAPVFSCAALLNAATCVMLLTWEPTRNDVPPFFVAAVMWGLYVGITFSQLRALFGVLFKADEEAANAAFHTWYALGFFFPFAFSSLLCTGLKIWAMIAVSTLGFVGYLLVERKHRTRLVDDKSPPEIPPGGQC
ncbi:hypothetical protein JTE90_027087 [Oedothorax gibbosus]|uniref:UNC93-like protein n=1 Tax=Oedothorax gibbosus TaxID=931172 RepID=A0AAV6U7H6_9ARAC|nr:hypothetical protein JTE90_027087 [Oedothorax gibbosus]